MHFALGSAVCFSKRSTRSSWPSCAAITSACVVLPAHGPPVTINPKDMVTFPKGWRGRWKVHSFLRKRYAFFDGKGIRVDEDEEEEEEEEGQKEGSTGGK